MAYLDELKRTQRALRDIVAPKCYECGESLTDAEEEEAKREGIKRPICNDCYADYLDAKYPEHPDAASFGKGR